MEQNIDDELIVKRAAFLACSYNYDVTQLARALAVLEHWSEAEINKLRVRVSELESKNDTIGR